MPKTEIKDLKITEINDLKTYCSMQLSAGMTTQCYLIQELTTLISETKFVKAFVSQKKTTTIFVI